MNKWKDWICFLWFGVSVNVAVFAPDPINKIGLVWAATLAPFMIPVAQEWMKEAE